MHIALSTLSLQLVLLSTLSTLSVSACTICIETPRSRGREPGTGWALVAPAPLSTDHGAHAELEHARGSLRLVEARKRTEERHERYYILRLSPSLCL